MAGGGCRRVNDARHTRLRHLGVEEPADETDPVAGGTSSRRIRRIEQQDRAAFDGSPSTDGLGDGKGLDIELEAALPEHLRERERLLSRSATISVADHERTAAHIR